MHQNAFAAMALEGSFAGFLCGYARHWNLRYGDPVESV